MYLPLGFIDGSNGLYSFSIKCLQWFPSDGSDFKLPLSLLLLPLGLIERVLQSKYAKIENSQILTRFVMILPEDANCDKDLQKAGLTHEGRIEFKATRAGIIERDYSHTMYSIEDEAKVCKQLSYMKYYFVSNVTRYILPCFPVHCIQL